MMTIREIAELSGCSASTVSRVLSNKKCSIPISEKTREKILAVCREHDYTPNINASRFFSNKAKTIGFFIISSQSLEDDNLARGMSAVYDTLNKHGYRLLPISMDEEFIKNKEYLNLFKRKEIDAAIIWGVTDDCDWIDELYKEKMPFLLLTNRFKDYPTVYCDDSAGINKLIEHCRKKGAEKFVYLSMNEGDCCFRRASCFSELIPDGKIVDGGVTIKDGENAAEEVMSHNPDAVICGNDRLAIGLEKALCRAGMNIPEDIMITGADNIELAEYCRVPLTNYDQMAYECGRKCAEMILGFLIDKKEIKSVKTVPVMHIRNSA